MEAGCAKEAEAVMHQGHLVHVFPSETLMLLPGQSIDPLLCPWLHLEQPTHHQPLHPKAALAVLLLLHLQQVPPLQEWHCALLGRMPAVSAPVAGSTFHYQLRGAGLRMALCWLRVSPAAWMQFLAHAAVAARGCKTSAKHQQPPHEEVLQPQEQLEALRHHLESHCTSGCKETRHSRASARSGALVTKWGLLAQGRHHQPAEAGSGSAIQGTAVENLLPPLEL
mmetsp:Transcript_32763/g.72908  ORF Transcript_32763/g.72908 Transcript_32763/m.72908 type:complete len:224 (+) Transcript_32763:1587-2258(+)